MADAAAAALPTLRRYRVVILRIALLRVLLEGALFSPMFLRIVGWSLR